MGGVLDGRAERRARGADAVAVATVAAASLLAAAAWLPFLRWPLSPDESGFWLLARQWRPGGSLYGDYWVDRPPLLLWLFGAAAHLGAAERGPAGIAVPGVKLLGALASFLSVALSGALARVLAPGRRWAPVGVAVVALALLANPRLGMPVANGEVLAVPFVLAGMVCLVASGRLRPTGVVLACAAAGALAASAALIKQNVVDVFVFAAVLLATGAAGRRWRRRLVSFGAGALGALLVSLVAAAARGTTPGGLGEAVVVFRVRAAGTLGESAPPQVDERLEVLVRESLTSGAVPLLVLAAGVVLATRRGPLAWAALAVGLWEAVGVLAGGSYWRHYLTGLVPGVVLLVALALARPARWRPLVAVTAMYAVLATASSWGHLARAPAPVSDEARAAAYLRAHARPGDQVVTVLGRPDIVAASGLSSPYPYLWSLPARVRDPRLHELTALLRGPHPPRWLAVGGLSAETWGVDATTAQEVIESRYARQRALGGVTVWRLRTQRVAR